MEGQKKQEMGLEEELMELDAKIKRAANECRIGGNEVEVALNWDELFELHYALRAELKEMKKQ